MTIQIIGVPASGKTTIINHICTLSKANYTAFEVGDFLRKNLGTSIFDVAYHVQAILKDNLHQRILMSSHLVHLDHRGVFRFSSLENEKIFSPKIFVCLHSPAQEILSRRLSDNKHKTRFIETVDMIEQHQNITLEYAQYLANRLGIPCLVLENTENVANTVEQVMSVISSIDIYE